MTLPSIDKPFQQDNKLTTDQIVQRLVRLKIKEAVEFNRVNIKTSSTFRREAEAMITAAINAQSVTTENKNITIDSIPEHLR